MRIVIADDHTLFRQGMSMLLSSQRDLKVVSEVSNGSDAVDTCATLKPDVVLMDISMPGLGSFEAVRQIRKAHPHTKVLFLSMYDDEDYLTQALESGASGYLIKDTPAQELVAAIYEVGRGGSHLSPRMLNHLVDDFRGRSKGEGKRSRFATLTARETEVLKVLAEGQSVKEIAGALNLSVKTVEAHKFNLMRKLDIHNKAQLVQYAIQKKVIRLDEPLLTRKTPMRADTSTGASTGLDVSMTA
jgi:two-component system, NarL family, response regulator NreC